MACARGTRSAIYGILLWPPKPRLNRSGGGGGSTRAGPGVEALSKSCLRFRHPQFPGGLRASGAGSAGPAQQPGSKTLFLGATFCLAPWPPLPLRVGLAGDVEAGTRRFRPPSVSCKLQGRLARVSLDCPGRSARLVPGASPASAASRAHHPSTLLTWRPWRDPKSFRARHSGSAAPRPPRPGPASCSSGSTRRRCGLCTTVTRSR